MKKPFQAAKRMFSALRTVKRDPRYVLALVWAIPLFSLTMAQALNAGWFDSIEKPVFHFINNLPNWLGGPMNVMTQLGSLGGMLLWMAAAWYLVNRRAALTVLGSGFLAWIAAKIAKGFVHRGRPEEFLHNIHLFNNQFFSGYGFPSGHSTLSAACATVLYYQVKPRYRKYILLTVLLVGFSRMYLGAHFPLDVVGGWALGVICGSVIMLLVGSSVKTSSIASIKRALKRRNYQVRSVRFVSLDARGSRPIYIELEDGTPYFGKVFGEQEHAADWLFKLYRFFRYKNLQAEEPYINGRRNIELESFANLWALKVGVRAPKVIDVIKVGRQWLLIQEQITAKGLPDLKRVKTDTLRDVWRQVRKLHDGNMAHRDLRAANIMVDPSGKAWLIDFGFAEASPNRSRKSMDIAELLMSMALVVGVKRTVEAAYAEMDEADLQRALPYLHKSVFSGATNQLLKKDKGLLNELQTAMHKQAGVEGEVEPVNIQRFTLKKLIYFILLAIFAYIIIPQFSEFRGALGALDHVRVGWTVPVFLFSLLTYIAAGAVIVALTQVPLKLIRTSIVQLAASFVSKIVPGGVGASGLNARYLTKAGLDVTESSAVIIGQNFLGTVMFIIPLTLLLLFNGRGLSSLFNIQVDNRVVIIIGAVVLLATAIVIISRKLRRKVVEFVARFVASLRDLSTSPRELALASAASLAITLAYVACLYSAIHAFHVVLSFEAAALVYASAIIAKSVVPTPGGLGAVEVAMSAALVGYGVDAGVAFAIVVLYRLATFWLPIPFSLLAYRHVTAKNII